MSDHRKLSDLAGLWCQRRASIHSPLHDPLRQIRVRLALRRTVLQATAQDGATARSPLHDVQGLVRPVVSAALGVHAARLVPHEHNLTPSRVDVGVHNTGELGGTETSAVDDDVGRLARVVQRSGVRDVREDGAFDLYAVLAALA